MTTAGGRTPARSAFVGSCNLIVSRDGLCRTRSYLCVGENANRADILCWLRNELLQLWKLCCIMVAYELQTRSQGVEH